LLICAQPMSMRRAQHPDARHSPGRRLAVILLAQGLVFEVTPSSGTGLKGPAKSMSTEDKQDVEIWVDLTLPALATARQASPAEREALRARVDAQQDEVTAALHVLGAVEIGRVQLLRNAVAVRLPRGRISEVKQISGVGGVRVVRHADLHPPDPKD
jgi:hypothetical protein